MNCPPVVASFLTQRQLSVNAGWQHMGRVPHPNYVDPECCVATVCHQIRFMYWEHLGHFQRAISHLKWHKIVCTRYLACTFSQMKSTDMFSMYLQSGVPRHFIWWFIAGSMLTTNSSDNMQKHGYLGCFHAASATENISGVCGIRRHSTHTFRLHPSSICDSIANALELSLCWTSLSIYNIPLRINHYL